ncbi:MAG: GTP-binding protein [Spirochaetales bacterium]|nr:GTP-binding protein [Spirochaetales bacterium]
MRIITVAGPPSSGKTSVIVSFVKEMAAQGLKVSVIKFDCLSSSDGEVYAKHGIPLETGLAGNLCPDHFFVNNIGKGIEWARQQGTDLLITESAGLCNRCAPHMKGLPAVCVIDALSGLNTPKKTGPMLRFADLVVVTKGDIVSQAEREVFAYRVKQAAPKAQIISVNGLTGQGVLEMKTLLNDMDGGSPEDDLALRFSMPTALCSYCLGEKRVGKDYQIGITREMSFNEK